MQAFYLEAAQGQWLKTLGETVALLSQPEALHYMGFDCSFDTMGQHTTLAYPVLLPQDSLARLAFNLVLGMLAHRGAA